MTTSSTVRSHFLINQSYIYKNLVCCVVLQKQQQQLGFRELLDASSSSAVTQCWFFHFWIESWQPRWARSERSMRLLSSPLFYSQNRIEYPDRHQSTLLIISISLCVLQFVADGVFFAELNEVLTRELAEDGYSGVEVRVTPMRTEIIIRATRTQNVLGIIYNTLSFLLACLLG